MNAKIVDGRKIAQIVKSKIAKEVKSLDKEYGIVPNIITIKIGNNPASELYLKLRNKACSEVGIKSSSIDFKENVSEKKVINTIKKLNLDKSVHGILIQFPIPKHISQDNLINSLDPRKDVEGFHPINIGNTLMGNENVVPCTPLSVLTILEHEKINLKGKEIVIVNHSNVVGKPLTALFLNRNATVTVVHIFSKDIKKFTKNAEILVTATGVKGIITKDFVKKGAFIIDVGIITTKTGICGDVDFESVKNIAGKITPVPGGVGPVTVASSLRNMLITFKNCMK